MTQPTFKGEQLYIGEEYRVKYISGNWVPGVKDYGTFIGKLTNVNKLPENKQTVYIFDKIRNEEMAPSMPDDQKEYSREYLREKPRRMMHWVIDSIEPIEPDVIVYKPYLNTNISKGGKRKSKKTRSKKNKSKNRSINRRKY